MNCLLRVASSIGLSVDYSFSEEGNVDGVGLSLCFPHVYIWNFLSSIPIDKRQKFNFNSMEEFGRLYFGYESMFVL